MGRVKQCTGAVALDELHKTIAVLSKNELLYFEFSIINKLQSES